MTLYQMLATNTYWLLYCDFLKFLANGVLSTTTVGTMLRRRRSCRKKQFSAEVIRMR
jgi:hypothetical protein